MALNVDLRDALSVAQAEARATAENTAQTLKTPKTNPKYSITNLDLQLKR